MSNIYSKTQAYFCMLFLFAISLSAQTTLTAGDVAVVGMNSDNPDEFSFVLLTDIAAGTKIYFTDSGVKSDGTFRANEGAIVYTAPTTLGFGTVINFSDISGDFANANDANVGTSGFNLSASGDQIIVFGGSTANPEFIFALTNYRDQFQTDATSTSESALPNGLTVGVTAVALGTSSSDFDNSVYNLSVTSGNKTTLLAAIANQANWTGNNSRIAQLPKNGDFSNGTPVAEIIVKGNNMVIADGDTTPSTSDDTNFGNSEVNTRDTATFTIVNNTGAGVSVSGITITGSNSANFILDSSALSFPFTIADTETKNITIEFTSTTVGAKTAVIEIFNDFDNFEFAVSATSIDTSTPIFIHDIQGSGTTSPMAGQIVTIEGIVVADFQDGFGTDGNLNGVFVQEEDADADTDSMTSEGIFVYDGFTPTLNVAVGDKVSVTGTVVEYYGVTEITNLTNISIISSSNALPTAASISLPTVNAFANADGELVPNLEHVEGMLVNFAQDLTVSELFNLDRFGEVKLVQGSRPEQFTQNNMPSISGYANHLETLAKRSIMLDDGITIQNPSTIRYPHGSL